MYYKCLLIVVVSFFSITLQSQMKIKFGKISKEEMSLTGYTFDTSAVAIIMSDIGVTELKYADSRGFYAELNRHVRIKILKKGGYDWANFSFSLYESDNSQSKEGIGGIKGVVYNLEGDEVVKTKMSKSAIFKDNVSDTRSSVKFTLPDIKVGTVFDVKYTYTTDYYVSDFPKWQFQHSIPVIYSQYITKIPEYFFYNPITYGYLSLNRSTENDNGSLKYSSYQNINGVQKRVFGEKTYVIDVDIYEIENVPPFRSEPYITARSNYIQRIEFECASIHYPWALREDYTKTWESINELLMDHTDFGLQFDKSGFFDDDFSNLDLEGKTVEEKIQVIHDFVVNKMNWNGKNSIFTTSNLRKAYKEESGNSADVNFIFMNMLRKAGLMANPVVLSTRRNGLLHPVYPSLSRFNYMVLYLERDDKSYLLDATNKNSPYYLIPQKCLNGKGRLISKAKTTWIDLGTNQSYKSISLSELKLSDEGILKGTVQNKKTKYAALDFRDSYKEEKSEEDLIKNMEQDIPGIKYISYNFENIDSCYAPLTEMYEIELDGYAEAMGDNIYFNPMLYDAMEENVFKMDNRKYPVDYAYAISELTLKKFTIPENYKVEEIPESKSIALPNRNGKFVYRISEVENEISLQVIFQINKSVFVPSEYPALKLFYEEAVKKMAEQIVLKKVS